MQPHLAQDELAKSLKERLHMPVAETLHLAHVLTHAVKGLLANNKDGIFTSGRGHGRVCYWVARLEFQDGKRKRGVHRDPQFYHGRGTLHIHILLWLEKMQDMELASSIRADLCWTSWLAHNSTGTPAAGLFARSLHRSPPREPFSCIIPGTPSRDAAALICRTYLRPYAATWMCRHRMDELWC